VACGRVGRATRLSDEQRGGVIPPACVSSVAGTRPATAGCFRGHLSSLRGRERSDSDVLGIRNDLRLVLFEQKGDDCLAVDLPFGHARRARSPATSSEASRDVATQCPTQAPLAAFVVEPTEDSNVSRQAPQLAALLVGHHPSAAEPWRLKNTEPSLGPGSARRYVLYPDERYELPIPLVGQSLRVCFESSKPMAGCVGEDRFVPFALKFHCCQLHASLRQFPICVLLSPRLHQDRPHGVPDEWMTNPERASRKGRSALAQLDGVTGQTGIQLSHGQFIAAQRRRRCSSLVRPRPDTRLPAPM
jgi:hypothetical protein